MIAYKLFRVRDGKLYPLFIGRSKPIPMGVWVEAECIPTKGYAVRPGWHVAPEPEAPHLCKRDGTMAADRRWARVEIPDTDNGWQEIAEESPTKDLRDRVPEGGFYRFPRPAHQGGEWLIAGRMKVIELLDADAKPSANDPRSAVYVIQERR